LIQNADFQALCKEMQKHVQIKLLFLNSVTMMIRANEIFTLGLLIDRVGAHAKHSSANGLK